MEFNYKDYQKGFNLPTTFGIYSSLDKVQYNKLNDEYDKNGKIIDRTFNELKKRTTTDYFNKVYKAQTEALTYSKKIFPTYKFIMPDVLTDDWMSTVDWHKQHPTRDHSLHQILTAYIVSRLLGGGDSTLSLKLNGQNGISLLDYCTDQILYSPRMNYLRNYYNDLEPGFLDNANNELKRMWVQDVFYETAIISALFHDMGYPWQYINRLAMGVDAADYNNILNLNSYSNSIMEMIKERLIIYPFLGYIENNLKHSTGILNKYVQNLINRGLKETHGFPGAIGFMCLNDQVRNYSKYGQLNDNTFRFIMDWAAVGIMMHDMVGLYWDDKETKTPQNPILRLSFETDPLSSLIALADVLEEFQRPYAVFNQASNNIEQVIVNYKFPCIETKLEIKGRTLYITYYYDSKISVNENENRRKKEIWAYFNPDNGFIDVKGLGITAISCNVRIK